MNSWVLPFVYPSTEESFIAEEAWEIQRRDEINYNGPGSSSVESALSKTHNVADQSISPRPSSAIVLLRTLPLLKRIPDDDLPKIAAVLKTVRFGPGEYIVRVDQDGDGLYIIWRGEAKVVTPPTKDAAVGHTVSKLKIGDYFGLAMRGPVKPLYRADVIANTEVTCLLLSHDYGDLISAASNWNWSDQPSEGEPSLVERALKLGKMEADTFKTCLPSPYPPRKGRPFTYGGSSIGQALAAATKTVDPGYVVHSLHSYFLLGGQEEVSTVYKVQRTRDGMSFATRSVEAIQLGRVRFVMFASFKRPDTQSYEHNDHPMPNVPHPEELIGDEALHDMFLADPRLPLSLKTKYSDELHALPPLEVRVCSPADKYQRVKIETRVRLWVKARHKLPDDPDLHRCVAAFASDLYVLDSSLRWHPQHSRRSTQVRSLDHAIWFHSPVKADEWMLYETGCSWMGDARALVFGRMYQGGQLVMTVSQEGMVRKEKDKAIKLGPKAKL